MNSEKHISEQEFEKLLKKRMNEYYKVIAYPHLKSSMYSHVKIGQLLNIEKLLKVSRKSNLFKSDFWGYGINYICDGYESHTGIDLHQFQRIPGFNKHHNNQRFLWLLTFNTSENYLYVNTHCIDTADNGVNSNLGIKYPLSDFSNARIKTRPNAIFVDFHFKNIDNPIHFQIDTFGQGGKLYAEELAEYYVKNLTEIANGISGFKEEENQKARNKVMEDKNQAVKKKTAISNKEKANLIDKFLLGLSETQSSCSFAEIIEKQQRPSFENLNMFKFLESEVEKYDLVIFKRGRDNSTLCGQCYYTLSGKGLDFVLNGKSTLELFEENLENPMDKESKIKDLTEKAEKYSEAIASESLMKSKANSRENIQLYKDWFLESREFLSEYFDDSEKSFKEFCEFDTIGNGFRLSSKFSSTYALFKILTKKIINLKSNDKLLEDRIDNVEKKLRTFFVKILTSNTGEQDFQNILTGDHKQKLKSRIRQHLEKHPRENFDNFKTLASAIEFSDINHFKESILKEQNWSYFEPFFKNKGQIEKYFDQLSSIRHTVKHTRKLSNLIRLEGMAALEWFEQVLN